MKRLNVSLVLLAAVALASPHSWGGLGVCGDPPGGPECEAPCPAEFACFEDAHCPDGFECADCDTGNLENCTSSSCFCDNDEWVCSGNLAGECIPIVPASSGSAAVILSLLLLFGTVAAVARQVLHADA